MGLWDLVPDEIGTLHRVKNPVADRFLHHASAALALASSDGIHGRDAPGPARVGGPGRWVGLRVLGKAGTGKPADKATQGA